MPWPSGCSWWCSSASPRGSSAPAMSELLTFWTPVRLAAGINSIIALGLYITMSSGPLSVAHAALAGMGGYLSAVLTTNFGWPFPVAIVAGMALGVPIRVPPRLPLLRNDELGGGDAPARVCDASGGGSP